MAHAAVVSLMHILEQIRHGDGVSDPSENILLQNLSANMPSAETYHLDLQKIMTEIDTIVEEVLEIEGVKGEQNLQPRNLLRSGSATSGQFFDFFTLNLFVVICDLVQYFNYNKWNSLNLNSHIISQSVSTRFDQDLVQIRETLCHEQQSKLQIVPIVGIGGMEIDTIVEEVLEIEDVKGEQNLQPRNLLPSGSAPSGQVNMVGFAQDLVQIRERLCREQQSQLQIVPIVGIGGMGKTTLTMNVFNDSYIKYRFDIRAWVTLFEQYRMRDILLSLLDDFVVTDHIREEDEELLKEYLYKNLKGRRYLIVVDDVRSIEVWNDIKMLFPNDKNGSRIILTSRLKDVADYVNSSNAHHQMRYLNEEESWNLFLEKAFGKENCPLDMVDVGKKIAKNCQGLPLLIVVISGLLSKVNKEKDDWEYVAENLNSIVAEKDDRCLEILNFSYTYLPAHLKSCFLYMGVFPENYEIPVSRLVNLWVVEGFLKPHEHKHLEEVAEEYLGDLIDRNLILVRQKGSINGKVKACIMHGLLRELCVRMAHEEEFLCVKSRYPHKFSEEETLQRRMSIHDDSSYSPNEEDMTMQSMSLVRSFIYIGWDDTQLHSYYYFGCRLLRVLDMVGVELKWFPDEILQLVNLRYIAITSHDEIPASIALLKNLHTLIVEDPWGIAVYLPEEILNLPQLRHLRLSRVSFLPGFVSPLMDRDKSFILENLEELSNVQDLGRTKQFLEKIPNVKKLGILYNINMWNVYDVHLQKLDTLKIFFESPTNSIFLRSITSSPRLKKITLEHCRIDWECMTIFGMLPSLEVLKLREFAFIGPEWIPTEGEFRKLRFLLIWETDLERWRADSTHFPRLEHLILLKCSKLVEIPSDIGEIQTLKIIEIDYSSPSAVKSAKDILEEQRDQGNEVLEVLFHQTKERLYPLKYGIQQDESGHFHRRKTKLDQLRVQKMVIKLGIHDEKDKQKAIKLVCSLSGIDSVSADVKEKKLTVIGDVDPIKVSRKLRESWYTEIVSVGPANY
ncbi:late blight resistance homolog R1B-16 isoform X1 [Olea europaea subsp. europaea]|uniref:Late blight resistance homolog R1B-16 isoform X1 n=1 Tax=Olea europaea subsp. europaea TaxID=158383 RepID=A0A8S0SLP0_OLEEU|nr:late blight resistance homolog R1B-16 isoform X1 [Olea europaea subsp. europaea]